MMFVSKRLLKPRAEIENTSLLRIHKVEISVAIVVEENVGTRRGRCDLEWGYKRRVGVVSCRGLLPGHFH